MALLLQAKLPEARRQAHAKNVGCDAQVLPVKGLRNLLVVYV